MARLNHSKGADVDKVRPVVVSQADASTEAGIPTLLVMPIPGRDRLLSECWAIAEQPRGVDATAAEKGPSPSERC